MNSDGSLKIAWPPLKTTKIDTKFICPICMQVMSNVHQADDCGCRFCLECFITM